MSLDVEKPADELFCLLFHDLYGKLVGFAKWRLAGNTRLVFDEQDIAQCALLEFLVWLRRKKPLECSRLDAWSLLKVIASRRISDQQRRVNRSSVAVSHVDTAFIDSCYEAWSSNVQGFRESEACDLHDILRDDMLVEICDRRINGQTRQEIAEAMGTSVRTVTRMLAQIRATILIHLNRTGEASSETASESSSNWTCRKIQSVARASQCTD